jgi:hypothetical protein
MPYILTPQFARFPKFYKKSDTEVPDALLNARAEVPDLADFPFPLPSKKSDYTCYANGNGGVVWYGAKTA